MNYSTAKSTLTSLAIFSGAMLGLTSTSSQHHHLILPHLHIQQLIQVNFLKGSLSFQQVKLARQQLLYEVDVVISKQNNPMYFIRNEHHTNFR